MDVTPPQPKEVDPIAELTRERDAAVMRADQHELTLRSIAQMAQADEPDLDRIHDWAVEGLTPNAEPAAITMVAVNDERNMAMEEADSLRAQVKDLTYLLSVLNTERDEALAANVSPEIAEILKERREHRAAGNNNLLDLPKTMAFFAKPESDFNGYLMALRHEVIRNIEECEASKVAKYHARSPMLPR